MKNSDFLLSIVIPVFNEEKNIPALLERLNPILKNYSHEVIFVDDGSTDATRALITKFAQKNNAIKLISFSRNFGHQNALVAGYEHMKGDCAISLDADCQDPPEVIPEMIEKWHKGAKIVYARRSKREVDGWLKKVTAQLFYKWLNFMSDIPIPQDVGDFRLLDKDVVQFIVKLPEHSKFLRGLVAWGGFPSDFVVFNREKRYSGQTHYTVAKMVNFALDGITSFSTKPLRLASYIGFIAASIGFLGIIYALIGKLFRPPFFPHEWVTGWTALFVGLMFIGGVQLITIGIIGEYISKIYKEVQKRPQYLIREKVNV